MNKRFLVLKYLQISLYTLKTVTYGAMALFTYTQIQMKGLHAPEDVMNLIDGPLGRIIIAAAVLEAIHNFIGLAKRIYSRNT
ncbi:hypothetical protein [Cohnella sp. AR92]|uniref:hypothetical protein n=1 Tax=Cohnella sp. AR92 TaxID=648716 RepID=UPI000F8F17B5|nr:hypothetical protein [Cohnella sp. AR92]RUS47931.1 hypothetical protein ELR57_05170 [Cohnella sp. AR92]